MPEDVDTPHGPARVHLHAAERPRALLMLGHGSGGSVTAPDLQAVTQAAVGAGVSVALVEQPYRAAGRRSAAPAHQLDAAWIAVAEHLSRTLRLPLITGGRSAGARVACRTAEATGARAVLCLAFPLITPKGASRQHELDAVRVPLLIVQGEQDRFGLPAGVVLVAGDHGLKRDLPAVAAAVVEWLAAVESVL